MNAQNYNFFMYSDESKIDLKIFDYYLCYIKDKRNLEKILVFTYYKKTNEILERNGDDKFIKIQDLITEKINKIYQGVTNNDQVGGYFINNKDLFNKYMKYKKKYLQLKQKLF